MSIFTDGLNLSIEPAMDQMAETVWINGSNPVLAIPDPVEKSTSRTIAGKMTEIASVVYMRRQDVDNFNVKKGDRISFSHLGGVVAGRVVAVEDDGTQMITLTCGPVLKGVVPV